MTLESSASSTRYEGAQEILVYFSQQKEIACKITFTASEPGDLKVVYKAIWKAFGIFGVGETPALAKADLKQAITIFMKAHLKQGDLPSILAKAAKLQGFNTRRITSYSQEVDLWSEDEKTVVVRVQKLD